MMKDSNIFGISLQESKMNGKKESSGKSLIENEYTKENTMKDLIKKIKLKLKKKTTSYNIKKLHLSHYIKNRGSNELIEASVINKNMRSGS